MVGIERSIQSRFVWPKVALFCDLSIPCVAFTR